MFSYKKDSRNNNNKVMVICLYFVVMYLLSFLKFIIGAMDSSNYAVILH